MVLAGYVKRSLKIAEICMPLIINKPKIKSSDYIASSCPETAESEQKLPLLKSVSVRKQSLTKEIAPAIFVSGQELASSCPNAAHQKLLNLNKKCNMQKLLGILINKIQRN